MKSTYETMGGKYRQDGEYLLPNLETSEDPNVGVWGEHRRKYLRENQKALCTAMMLSSTLNAHQARNREMVNRSLLVVFCILHESGGARQTMKYARRQGVPLINIQKWQQD